MSHKPSHHFSPWSPEEVNKLERMLSEGTSPREIARELGRTRGSVTAKANALKKSREAQPSPGPDILDT